VALLTGDACQYKHHAPDFLTAGGTRAELDALATRVKGNPRLGATHYALGPVEQLVFR
jgi:hypothetical protein